jgi:hypothetical protein
MHAFSRLAGQKSQRLKSGVYFFVNAKAASACPPPSKSLDLLVRL